MNVTITPKRGRERIEQVPDRRPCAALCLALWQSGSKLGYIDMPYSEAPGLTVFRLSDGGEARVSW